jgi:hypothetical protein
MEIYYRWLAPDRSQLLNLVPFVPDPVFRADVVPKNALDAHVGKSIRDL